MPMPFANSGIYDNYSRARVGDFLRNKISPGAELSIVSAYFTIYAYEALKAQLDQIGHLRFLFGEPRFVKAVDPGEDAKKAFRIEENELRLLNRGLQQKRIARECAAWIRFKVEIRSVKRAEFLHGKMYHVASDRAEDALIGSSNFTVRGLGLADGNSNIELNLEVDSRRDRQDLKAWFDTLWDDDKLVQDVKDDVLRYLEQLYGNVSPEFIYYKTLYHLFADYLAQQKERSDLLEAEKQIVDTEIWKALFEFQKDGVKGAINKILAHNGCVLADSVGLGKTFEALAVIKYFELRNYRVLVLCPKKLRENWTVYQAQNNSALNPFVRDRFAYTVLSHTDLSRDGGKSGDIDLSSVSWGNFDLIVIDESHNFRNAGGGSVDEHGNKRLSRYERLMKDIIKSGVKTRVLLLSATPVNNSLADLRNQLMLIAEGDETALRASTGIPNIKETLKVAQAVFTDWVKRPGPERNTLELQKRFGADFFTLLDQLTIARSRKHVKKYYKESVERLGGFPVRTLPLAVYPDIDLQGEFYSYDALNRDIDAYKLALFNPSFYVQDQYRPLYEETKVRAFTQAVREDWLIAMMKVNFLKRLESSVSSFAETMERTVRKIEQLEARIQRFKAYRAGNPDIDFDELQIEDVDDEELQEALEVGKKLKFKMAHLKVDEWLAALAADKRQLQPLLDAARKVTTERDAKLDELKRIIRDKAQNPTRDKKGRPNRKVLVFTAFADTAAYLYDALKPWARDELGIHLAMVTGGARENQTTYGKNEFNAILTNFSPISKKRGKVQGMAQDAEIDLLIATDCISEGQNLQDCDTLVNYDIHWNPVRVIQRFGRIDRIGSINPAVQLINFWPTRDLDNYIKLKARVEARMALVDVAATNEDNLLSPTDLEDLITEELKYRDKQLLRLREEVLDLEDFDEGGVSLNQFTLDDFRMELQRYIEANKEQLKNAPEGLYTVVPNDPSYAALGPGVIYCLRQAGKTDGTEAVNPLRPYFLAYVRDDGTVRFNFTQPKQILELYRVLCAGKTAPYEALCDLFDQETCGGTNMDCYGDLLEKALKDIAQAFRKRNLGNLLGSRTGVLIDQSKQANEESEYELVTWLVIK
jgi:SNF2 family DNA or RNA helicase